MSLDVGSGVLLEKSDSDLTQTLLIGLVIGLVIGGFIGYLYTSFTNKSRDSNANQGITRDFVGPEEAENMTLSFVNQNLLQPGLSAEARNISEKNGVYEVVIGLNTPQGPQNIPVYVSKDGTLLFLQPPIDMSEPLPKPPETADTTGQAHAQDIDMRELADDDPWSGSKDAKVVIVEFSDFQCPFCARAFPTVQQIKSTYGDRILFVYRDFPLSSIHPDAEKAAEAAQCAFEQDRFWDYHDLLFGKQDEWVGVGVPKFMEYASDIGLDSEAFNGCLNSGKYAEEVAKDQRDGAEVGVTGTPAFIVNGQLISGAQPFAVFQNAIDAELAKTG